MSTYQESENFCLILCGGHGTRLWPLSRDILPKQFVKLKDDKSLLDDTIERNLIGFQKENIFFVTDELSKFHTSQSAKKYKINLKNIIVEPSARDTCAAIALGFKTISNIKENSRIYITPSDHHIDKDFNIKEYLENIEGSYDFIIFGISITEPNTNYGYIKVQNLESDIQKVIEFKEKPDIETAKKYENSMKYFWNSGMFLINSTAFFKQLEIHNFDTFDLIKKTELKKINSNFTEYEEEFYNQISSISIDYALMEKVEDIYVKKFTNRWSDLGNWASFFKYLKDIDAKETNKLFYESSSKNINIYNNRDQDISVVGMNDVDIINTRDDIFIVNNSYNFDFKSVHKDIIDSKIQNKKEYSKDYRPWGWFENLLDEENYKVKRLCVYPGARLSLQKHFKRSEHWVVVNGVGIITKGNSEFELKEGESVFLEKEEIHRITNNHEENLIIIETQIGECIEDDIVRFEDDFNRS